MPDHRRAQHDLFHPEPNFSPFEPIRRELMRLKACIEALKLIEEMKYSPDQPRWPAGDPRGGQWMPQEGGEGASRRKIFRKTQNP